MAAERNAAANGFALTTRTANAFDALADLHTAGTRFNVVVLDPPAFIKRRKDAARGQAAYRKLNLLALQLLAPDALLVSCSCSYHLTEAELLALIQSAAVHAGAQLQLLAVGGQAPDHPVHPAIIETRYLKAMFCRVLR
jgi:23S rRNA (cytosine1962-C5)-methyltransferase